MNIMLEMNEQEIFDINGGAKPTIKPSSVLYFASAVCLCTLSPAATVTVAAGVFLNDILVSMIDK